MEGKPAYPDSQPVNAERYLAKGYSMKTQIAHSKLQQLINNSAYGSIQTLIIVPFVIQVVVAVGLTGYLSFRSGQRSVNDVATQLREEITARVNQNLQTYLATPPQINQLNREVIDRAWLPMDDQEAWTQHLWHQLQVFPGVGAINWATEQGEFVGVGRNENGSLVLNVANQRNLFAYEQYGLDNEGRPMELLKRTSNYDPRTRPQYEAAVVAGRATWSDVFPHITDPMLVISAVEPVYDGRGQLQGVLQTRLNLSLLSEFLESLNIGKTGQVFIVESSGMLVASSADKMPFRRANNQAEKIKPEESENALIREASTFLTEKFSSPTQITEIQQLSFKDETGQRIFVQVSPFHDAYDLRWLVIVAIPESDFMAEILRNQRHTFILCILALLGSVLVGLVTSRWITRPILQLKDAAIDLAQGNFDQDIDIHRKDELGILAGAFNSMASQLQDVFAELQSTNEDLENRVKDRTKDLEAASQQILVLNTQLKEDNLRMSAELDIARILQEMILPKEQELQQIPGLDIAGFMQAANEVGGDYYDVLTHQDGLVRIGIGDVTGHGLESGVLMIMVQTAVRTLLIANEHDPVKVLNTLNQVIYENVQRMDTDKNLSLMLLDYQDGHISLSGQHEEMIVVRKNGDLERIDTIDLGFPIGLINDITEFVAQQHIDLFPGDVAVLYTDGITEAESSNRKFYGLPRLANVIQSNHQASAYDICQAIVIDLQNHIDNQIVHDDITLIVLKQK